MVLRRWVATVYTLLLLPATVRAIGQDTTVMARAPRVYVDCSYCDLDYIRQEIPYVNYVRDPADAQVHVLITTQRTGGGGEEYTLVFLGRGQFLGRNDTLRFSMPSTATEHETRSSLVRTLRMGLVPYVARTPVASLISVQYMPEATTTEVTDRWKNWVFRLSLNAFGNGERSSRSVNLYGSFSASRVTPLWKIQVSVNADYSENRFEYDDTKIFSYRRGRGFRGLIVRSLNDHWSVGLRTGMGSSTYSNIQGQFSLSPALEFNVFPYSQSTHRELRLQYGVRGEHVRYLEETIFDRWRESPVSHFFSVTLTFRQPWGSTETSVTASQYWHDLSKNRLELWNVLMLRLFGGLTLQVVGSFSRIHDQLSLPKRGASKEEVLLQRRELATNYSFFGSVGISYTFGSIYSNVVNPRFGSETGGVSIIIR
ncbi:MAG: hypothetical protein ONB23_09470 [candidate division KSB1 bacterium]|nr:hypothetical protein [candidate division KSB1 bacterium]